MLGEKLGKFSLRRILGGVLGGSMILLTNPQNILAAEKVTFTYGLASQSVSLKDLEAFAATGEISPSVRFLLNTSGQNPDVVRWLLIQKFPSDTAIASKLFNSKLGEYILKQSTRVVYSRSQRADIQAMRGALIVSSENDGKVSLLEFWRNYPTKQVYVDGKFLVELTRNVK